MIFINGFMQNLLTNRKKRERHRAVFPCYIQSVPQGGFLCSTEHGKLCFEHLKRFPMQNNLPLQGLKTPSEVRVLYGLKMD
jgi:hypothetical protein